MARGKVGELAHRHLRYPQLFRRENPTADADEVGVPGTAATSTGRLQLTRAP